MRYRLSFHIPLSSGTVMWQRGASSVIGQRFPLKAEGEVLAVGEIVASESADEGRALSVTVEADLTDEQWSVFHDSAAAGGFSLGQQPTVEVQS